MTSLVDFNVSTPRNRTQSSNECGVVINNTIHNGNPPCARSKRVERNSVVYPGLDLEAASVAAGTSQDPRFAAEAAQDPRFAAEAAQDPRFTTERDIPLEPSPIDYDLLILEHKLYKELALALSRILKNNNHKLLANLIDQSGKVIIDVEELCVIISKQLDIPLEFVHIEYIQKDPGCLAKVSRIHDIQNIKINHIDYKLGYNEKYNLLSDTFSISLTRCIA